MNRLRQVFVDAYRIWTTQHPARQAAALAYYSMFAFAPILYVVLRVAGLFLNQAIVTESLSSALSELLGAEVAGYIRELVINAAARTETGSPLTTAISVLALIYAATGLFVHLKHSLNDIWQAPKNKRGGLMDFLLNRALAFALVIGLGVILIVAVFAGVSASVLSSLLGISPLYQFANLAIACALSIATFTAIFKVLPEVPVRWTHACAGAVMTTILVGIGGSIILAYLRLSHAATAFEAAGSLAVLLIGIYYVAQLFLAGAVFTRALAPLTGEADRDRAEIRSG